MDLSVRWSLLWPLLTSPEPTSAPENTRSLLNPCNLRNKSILLRLLTSVVLYYYKKIFTCLWFSLELAGNFGKECEGETGSGLPVTYATFAAACLTALNPIGSISTVCMEEEHFNNKQQNSPQVDVVAASCPVYRLIIRMPRSAQVPSYLLSGYRVNCNKIAHGCGAAKHHCVQKADIPLQMPYSSP